MTTAVTVVIPTYNRAASLRVALEHIGRQTYTAGALEVVVVDDGSTDNTSAVAARPQPFPLRYIRQAIDEKTFVKAV